MGYGLAELLCSLMGTDADPSRRRISMDIADVLTKLRVLERALERYRSVEEEARNVGDTPWSRRSACPDCVPFVSVQSISAGSKSRRVDR